MSPPINNPIMLEIIATNTTVGVISPKIRFITMKIITPSIPVINDIVTVLAFILLLIQVAITGRASTE